MLLLFQCRGTIGRVSITASREDRHGNPPRTGDLFRGYISWPGLLDPLKFPVSRNPPRTGLSPAPHFVASLPLLKTPILPSKITSELKSEGLHLSPEIARLPFRGPLLTSSPLNLSMYSQPSMPDIMQAKSLRHSSKFVEGRLKLSTSCVECHRRKQKVWTLQSDSRVLDR